MDRVTRSKKLDSRLWWGFGYKWVIALLLGLGIAISVGLGVKSWRGSQVVGHSKYRFNMAVIVPDVGVTFVSFDPSEKSILSLAFPTNLAINSRTSGEYSISSLYKLGSYKGEGGKFVRQKIQGFMRVPIPGYLIVNNANLKIKSMISKGLLKVLFGRNETSLTRFDAILLLYRSNRYAWRQIEEDELVRAGVVEGNVYHPDRLQEYVGSRLFDWGIGATGMTIAIVNASGENGLGSDMADFLSNLGFDVVMVRSVAGNETLDTSSWQVNDASSAKELGYIFESLFSLDKPKIDNIPEEYRSKVLLRVGKDAKELF